MLADLVRDPRLRLMTDAITVTAGAQLEDWDGGEVDPVSLEMVRHTDASLVAGWVDPYVGRWRYVGPSPYKRLFGRRAIGGRVHVITRDEVPHTGFLDALATPRPPAWVTHGWLREYQCGRVHGLKVVWRPARGNDPGDAFLIRVRRNGEAVAWHTVGTRMPQRAAVAAWAAGFSLWSLDLTDRYSDTRISYETTRQKRDAAMKIAQQHS